MYRDEAASSGISFIPSPIKTVNWLKNYYRKQTDGQTHMHDDVIRPHFLTK